MDSGALTEWYFCRRSALKKIIAISLLKMCHCTISIQNCSEFRRWLSSQYWVEIWRRYMWRPQLVVDSRRTRFLGLLTLCLFNVTSIEGVWLKPEYLSSEKPIQTLFITLTYCSLWLWPLLQTRSFFMKIKWKDLNRMFSTYVWLRTCSTDLNKTYLV